MTIGEWNSKPFNMVWSIYNEESYNEYDDKPYGSSPEKDVEDYESILLDLTAPEGVPDGMYPVYHCAGLNKHDEGKSVGVMVCNGQFVPEPTQASVFEAVCQSYGVTADDVRTGKEFINHVFIEGLDWDDERRAFKVTTGS